MSAALDRWRAQQLGARDGQSWETYGIARYPVRQPQSLFPRSAQCEANDVAIY